MPTGDRRTWCGGRTRGTRVWCSRAQRPMCSTSSTLHRQVSNVRAEHGGLRRKREPRPGGALVCMWVSTATTRRSKPRCAVVLEADPALLGRGPDMPARRGIASVHPGSPMLDFRAAVRPRRHVPRARPERLQSCRRYPCAHRVSSRRQGTGHYDPTQPDEGRVSALMRTMRCRWSGHGGGPSRPGGGRNHQPDARRCRRPRVPRAHEVRRDGSTWRRVVGSPKPQQVVETSLIRLLLDSGAVVICAGGGGGVPVIAMPGETSRASRRWSTRT
jgi:hypothetical protein